MELISFSIHSADLYVTMNYLLGLYGIAESIDVSCSHWLTPSKP